MSFLLALVQMRVVGGNKVDNINRAVGHIAGAAERGADLVLLPEAMDLGWTDPASALEAEPIPEGWVCRTLMQAAKEHGVFVCAGLTEADGNRVYNTAVLLDRRGEVLCRHRKLNELEIGHQSYQQGDRLSVVQTEIGAVGLMICSDAFAEDQVISRSLCYMGADVILSPCAWAVAAEHDNEIEPYGELWRESYCPVARDYSVWIAGASNVGLIRGGPWQGKKCIGCSLVVDAEGQIVARGPYGENAETTMYVKIVPKARPARGCGWQSREM